MKLDDYPENELALAGGNCFPAVGAGCDPARQPAVPRSRGLLAAGYARLMRAWVCLYSAPPRRLRPLV